MPRNRSASPKRRQRKPVIDTQTLAVFQILIANYCEFEVLAELYCSAKALWPCFHSISATIYQSNCSHVLPIETAEKWKIYFKCYRRPMLTAHIANLCLLYQMFHRFLACNYVDLALELADRGRFKPRHFVRGTLLSGRIETFVKVAELFDEDGQKRFIKSLLRRFWTIAPVFSNSLYHSMAGKYGIEKVPRPSTEHLILYLKDAAEVKSDAAVSQAVETLELFVMSPVVFGQRFQIRFRQQIIAQRNPEHVPYVTLVIQAFESWNHPYSRTLIDTLLVHLTQPPILMPV
jgi:hypothetical protein